jgi:hypothetical protein
LFGVFPPLPVKERQYGMSKPEMPTASAKAPVTSTTMSFMD